MKLTHLADNTLEDFARVVTELPSTIETMQAAMAGQPGAQSFEQSRTTGHTTVTDERGNPMPAVSDPTGEAAVLRVMGKDKAAVDEAELHKRMHRIAGDVEWLYRLCMRWHVRPATERERRDTASHNEPGCESCATVDIAPGVKRWEPIRCAIEFGERKIAVCRWCQDFAARKDRLPTREELLAHHAGKRVA